MTVGSAATTTHPLTLKPVAPFPLILNLLKDDPPPFRPIPRFPPPFPSFNKFRMSGNWPPIRRQQKAALPQFPGKGRQKGFRQDNYPRYPPEGGV